jgi:hypothetical protein
MRPIEQGARLGLWLWDELVDRFHRRREPWLVQRIVTLKSRAIANKKRGWYRLARGQLRRAAARGAELAELRRLKVVG